MESWKPKIWETSKTNPEELPQELRLPIGVSKECTPIADIDVTFNDLKHPSDKKSLFPIIEFLRAFWVGNNKERETNCRIGTMYVYFDKHGSIHMDFASRFALPKDLQNKMLKVLKQAWHSINNS